MATCRAIRHPGLSTCCPQNSSCLSWKLGTCWAYAWRVPSSRNLLIEGWEDGFEQGVRETQECALQKGFFGFFRVKSLRTSCWAICLQVLVYFLGIILRVAGSSPTWKQRLCLCLQGYRYDVIDFLFFLSNAPCSVPQFCDLI